MWITVMPGLKATKPQGLQNTLRLKEQINLILQLLLTPPIPCEVCTRAALSGSREHLQPSSGIGQTRVSKSTSWISMSVSTWTQSAPRSCGQSAQTHFTPKPTCTHGVLVAGPKIYTPAWGAELSDRDTWHKGRALLLERRMCNQVPAHIFPFICL